MAFEQAPQGSDVGTEVRTFPEPPIHGAGASFVTGDDLYERLDNRLPAHADDAVLTDSFSPGFLPDETYCILVTTSNCGIGVTKNGRFEPYTEYSFKIRRTTEDGKPAQSTPRIALAVSVMPQDSDAVTENGTEFSCPFGEGTRLKIQTTNIAHPNEFIDRAAALLKAAVGYDLPRSFIKPASKRIFDLEVTHRFHTNRLGSVVETVRDTEALLTYAEGPSEVYRSHDGRGWIEAVLSSPRFDLLGFDFDDAARLKVYTPQSLSTDTVIRHPRIETRLGEGVCLHFDQFDDVVSHLRAIVCSHLLWADVTSEDIVSTGDPLYDVPRRSTKWNHPVDRQDQLRERHYSVATTVKKAALRPNTMAIYDILKTVLEYPGCTYNRLVEEVGLCYSSIQRHVSRLVERDIFSRDTGAVTIVTYASKEIHRRARQALKTIYPGDTQEDRKERRRERRLKRARQSLDRSGDDTDTGSDDAISLAEADLTADEIPQHVRAGRIDPDDVVLREPPPGERQDD